MVDDLKEVIKSSIDEAFSLYPIVNDENRLPIEALKKNLTDKILEIKKTSIINDRLATLFAYEKNYLELLKEYKEEIKFASSLQEDLRKERAKFFSSVLDEVSNTLKNSQVDEKVASSWIVELVNSYTKSLDSSSNIVSENTLESISSLREKSKEQKKSLED
ncbi:MAG: hypothetical protein ABF802_06815 [Acetobacter orientalis]|uniref:hypothetical protein n=1 Tax=Acetobacter orientalis TaxID=146474 RepID=UPI0039EAA722